MAACRAADCCSVAAQVEELKHTLCRSMEVPAAAYHAAMQREAAAERERYDALRAELRRERTRLEREVRWALTPCSASA